MIGITIELGMMKILLFGLIIIVLLYLSLRIFRFIRYKKSPYYQITKKPFSKLDQGEIGEYLIWRELKSFERKGGRFLFNLYIPKTNNETTEVDVVLIHPKSFFVIESKNYNGWIFGHDRKQYWTQTLPKGRGHESHKERFYSPIRQNGSHIKHIKRVLSDSVPMWSVIVFSDKCTLKDVTVSSDKRYKVIQLHELKSQVSQLIKETSEDLFSESKIQWMYDELFPFTQVDEETKKQHAISIER